MSEHEITENGKAKEESKQIQENWKEAISEIKQDFSLSWKLFKENWKPFIATNLFTLILILVLILSSLWLLTLAGVLDFNYLNFQVSSSQPFVNIRIGRENVAGISQPIQLFYVGLVIFIYIIVFIISTSLEGTLFGLGYEILSSGNEFAEFRSAFKYFKKYWYKFVLLSLIFVLVVGLTIAAIFSIIVNINPEAIINQGPNQDSSDYNILFSFFINIIFMFIYPALIETGSVWKSIKKNFRFLKQASIRVLLINLIFTGILIAIQLPVFVMHQSGSISFIIIAIISNSFEFLFLKSLRILVITRAYNSLLFKPIIEKKQSQNTEKEETR